MRQCLRPSAPTDHGETDADATLTAIRREFPQVCLEVEIPFDDAFTQNPDLEPAVISTPDVHQAFSVLAHELTTRIDGPVAPVPQPIPSQDVTTTEEPPPTATRPRRSWWRRLFS